MDCQNVIQQIANYLDEEMDSGLKGRLETHLKMCHHCQVVFDSTRKTIELYCDGRLFPLPDDVRERLHQVLKQKCQGKSG